MVATLVMVSSSFIFGNHHFFTTCVVMINFSVTFQKKFTQELPPPTVVNELSTEVSVKHNQWMICCIAIRSRVPQRLPWPWQRLKVAPDWLAVNCLYRFRVSSAGHSLRAAEKTHGTLKHQFCFLGIQINVNGYMSAVCYRRSSKPHVDTRNLAKTDKFFSSSLSLLFKRRGRGLKDEV